MADKTWKRVEREKCRTLGGQRTGPRGFGLPDCVGLKVALEVKYLKRFTFLTKHWEQAVENAERVGLPPVLAVKETGRNGRDCVQMHERDFMDLLGASANTHGFITIPPRSLLNEGTLTRFPWSDFVRLYTAAYIDKEEN